MKKPHNVMYLRRAVRHLFDTDEKAYKMRVMMANVVIGQILPDGVVRGSKYLPTVASLLADKVIREDEIVGFSDENRERILRSASIRQA